MNDTAGIYADRFYEIDPQHEDVIYGSELRDGMIVLLASGMMRGDPARAFRETDEHARYEVDRCRETSRWCTVTRLLMVPRPGYEPLVRFIAEYADGTKRDRTYSSDYAWYVKRDSLPAVQS